MNCFDFFHLFPSLPLSAPLFQNAILRMYVCVSILRFEIFIIDSFLLFFFNQRESSSHSDIMLFYENEQRGTIDSHNKK